MDVSACERVERSHYYKKHFRRPATFLEGIFCIPRLIKAFVNRILTEADLCLPQKIGQKTKKGKACRAHRCCTAIGSVSYSQIHPVITWPPLQRRIRTTTARSREKGPPPLARAYACRFTPCPSLQSPLISNRNATEPKKPPLSQQAAIPSSITFTGEGRRRRSRGEEVKSTPVCRPAMASSCALPPHLRRHWRGG